MRFFKDIQASHWRLSEFEYLTGKESCGVIPLCSSVDYKVNNMLLSSIQPDRERQQLQQSCGL